MAVMTAKEIEAHEANWCAAVKRHQAASEEYREASDAMDKALAELTKAERERREEWEKLTTSSVTRPHQNIPQAEK